jgi:hypothetical protein
VGKSGDGVLLSLINGSTRAGEIFHLNLLGIEFGRCGCHPIERLIERQRSGILWPEPDRIHPRHHETLEIGTRQTLRFQCLNLFNDLIV